MADTNDPRLAELQERANQELEKFGRILPDTAAALEDAETGIKNFSAKVDVSSKVFQKLVDAQLAYTKAMVKGTKGAAAYNESLDSVADAATIAVTGLVLLSPASGIIKAVVSGLTFLANSTMKVSVEMQKLANEQADSLYKSFQQLSKTGATAGDGVTGLARDVKSLSLNMLQLDQYIQLVNENSQELATMGGTVFQGRKQFVNLVKDMQGFQAQLMNLGLDFEDQADAAMSYAKLQNRLSLGQQRDYTNLGAAAAKYIQETDLLTKVTGLSRKQQEAALEKAMRNQRFAAKVDALRANGETEAADNLIKGLKLAQMAGQDFADAYEDTAAGFLTSDAAIKGSLGTNNQLMQTLNDITSGRIKGDQQLVESFQKLYKVTGENITVNQNATAQMGVLESYSLSYATGAKAATIGANDMAAALAKAVTEQKTQMAAQDPVQKAHTNLLISQNEEMKKLQGSLVGLSNRMTAFDNFLKGVNNALEPLLGLFNGMVDVLNPLIEGLGKGLVSAIKIVTSLLTGDFSGVLTNSWQLIKDVFGGIWGAGTKLVDGIAKFSEFFAENIKKSFSDAFNLLPNLVKDGMSTFSDTLVAGVKSLISKLMGLLDVGGLASKAGEATKGAVSSAGSAVKGFMSNMFGGGGGSAAPAGATAQPTAPAGDAGGAQRQSNNIQPPAAAGASAGALDDAMAKAMIAKHEGVRDKPYKDSLGLWTVGVGHLIGDGKVLPDNWNRKFSQEEIMSLFDKDYDHHKAAAMANIPNFDKMTGAMKAAFVDLTFNMGPAWINKWPNLKKQLSSMDLEGAMSNLAGSKWATQVGSRAGNILDMIKSGFGARDGGVFDGPKSGYPMTLHGPEAVIPLKNGAVPVSMGQEFNTTATNLGELVDILKNNVGMQDRMLAVLEDMRRSQGTTADNTGKMVALAA